METVVSARLRVPKSRGQREGVLFPSGLSHGLALARSAGAPRGESYGSLFLVFVSQRLLRAGSASDGQEVGWSSAELPCVSRRQPAPPALRTLRPCEEAS